MKISELTRGPSRAPGDSIGDIMSLQSRLANIEKRLGTPSGFLASCEQFAGALAELSGEALSEEEFAALVLEIQAHGGPKTHEERIDYL
jgi:hypothetical protein